MRKYLHSTIGTAVLAALLMPCVAEANASLTIRSQIIVRYGDLDLRTRTGAEAMLRRLDRAADDACGGDPALMMNGDHFVQALRPEYRNCHAGALRLAVAKLGQPLVSLAYRSREAIRLADNARHR